jgi:hypothetical protein
LLKATAVGLTIVCSSALGALGQSQGAATREDIARILSEQLTPLVKRLETLETSRGIPRNVVLAFDIREGCPSGGDWEEFKPAMGRFIIGAGKGEDLSPREFGIVGGQERYVLTRENLPPHSHEVYQHAGKIVGNTGVNGAGSADTNLGSQVLPHTSGDGPGQSKPYDVIPPFIALIYCKKVR